MLFLTRKSGIVSLMRTDLSRAKREGRTTNIWAECSRQREEQAERP